MDTLIALLGFMLSLCGVEVGGTTLVQHSRVDGADVLVSRATVHRGTARLQCVRSASGRCDYTVVARRCLSAVRPGLDCLTPPVEHFSLPANGSRRLAGVHGMRLCVSAGNGARAECEALGPGVD